MQKYKLNYNIRGLAINRYLKIAKLVIQLGKEKDVYILLALIILNKANRLF